MRGWLVKSVDLLTSDYSEQHIHMASLLGAKMLLLIRLGWEANETRLSPIFTIVDQRHLNYFHQPWARDPARLGSVRLRIAVRLDSELVSQLERLDLACGSARFARSPGPAQGSAHRSSARLGSLFGTRRISARESGSAGDSECSARGSARGSAEAWLENRDSVLLGSGLS